MTATAGSGESGSGAGDAGPGDAGVRPGPGAPEIPEELRHRWRLTAPEHLGEPHSPTWRVTRDGVPLVAKCLSTAHSPDWQYPWEVGLALRRLGWPTPEPVEEPWVDGDGAWALFAFLPGRPAERPEPPAEQRARGRLLAAFHAAGAETGIVRRRVGYPPLERIVADPELARRVAAHERRRPEEGALLRRHLDAARAHLAELADAAVPVGVVHGDFAPWNLLREAGRLTGLLDLAGAHRNPLVTDFALAWRGHHDEVLRGYEEVRPLSEAEWRLLLPTYWAWLFLGVRDALAAHQAAGGDGPSPLAWQLGHLRRVSPLVAERSGLRYPTAD
ncbi:phosphotransferase [Streptomyces sp. 3MP-14]|uniref:Phosphotransferase n=1 Tax=Streptomyces mimosae TaxID=2586635 RepID=A0A5N6AQI2_9ACTN|nr:MULTISPECIES: phosphotransferase [Streptomyces]KAB8170941.1 phosphotransferase [Streptomyces mimosae]KAB8179708.1 phosphotransferase [Streptomyces sp. 3MP-14]